MPFRICLQDETGETIESVTDVHGILDGLMPFDERDTFPTIGYIDPYGDTTFNRIQMEPFLAEWRSLHARCADSAVAEMLKKVEHLATQCLNEPHWYLKFEGD